MRILNITATAFGPFNGTVHADIAAGTADGVLLIRGKTGSGKSTLLDAISFALYGTAYRYQGLSGEGERLRNQNAAPETPTKVALEFEIGSRRLRIERIAPYSRPNKRNPKKLTQVKADATLSEFDGERWRETHAGMRQVGLEMSALLPLSKEQFFQVIMLAQGGFKRFLEAGQDERAGTLRRLFGTELYLSVQTILRQQAGEALAAATKARERIAEERAQLRLELAEQLQEFCGEAADEDPDDDTQAAVADYAPSLARLSSAVSELAAGAAAATEKYEAARAAYSAAQRDNERLEEVRKLRARLAELEQREETEIQELRARQQRLLQAQQLAPLVRQAQQAAKSVAQARETVERVRASMQAQLAQCAGIDAELREQVGTVTEADDPTTQSIMQQLQQRTAANTALLAAVTEVAALTEAVAGESEKLSELTAQAEGLAAEAERVPVTRAEKTIELQQAEVANTQLAALHAELAKLQELQTIAATAAKLEVELAQQNTKQLALREEFAQKSAAHSAKIERRFAQIAGELAQELTDGQPCKVCGSLDHPQPAPLAADSVHAEDITDAAAERAQAESAFLAAQQNTAKLTAKLAGLQAQLAGQTSEDITGAASELSTQIDATAAVAATAEHAREALAKLDARARTLQTQQLETQQQITALQTVHAQSRERLTQLQEQLDASEQPAEDAQTQQQLLARASNTLEEFIAALEQTEQSITLHTRAAGAVAELAAELELGEGAEELAATDTSELPALTQTLQQHDTELAATKARLGDYTAEKLPGEKIDLGALETDLAQKKQQADAAQQTATVARVRVDQAVAAASRVAQLQEKLDQLLAGKQELIDLAATVNGEAPNTKAMRLETYVQAAQLEQVLRAANTRLAQVSSGRYRLQHTASKVGREHKHGLGIEVLDTHGGAARPTLSLSGGESFLVSLCLALGLADTVTAANGGVRIDTLFIDEGFGTLDPEALDEAAALLDQLRAGGRGVAVISHVPQLHEQFTRQIIVDTDGRGNSTLRQNWTE